MGFVVVVCWRRSYGKRQLREKGNPLASLHGLLFLISSKGSFIYNITQTG